MVLKTRGRCQRGVYWGWVCRKRRKKITVPSYESRPRDALHRWWPCSFVHYCSQINLCSSIMVINNQLFTWSNPDPMTRLTSIPYSRCGDESLCNPSHRSKFETALAEWWSGLEATKSPTCTRGLSTLLFPSRFSVSSVIVFCGYLLLNHDVVPLPLSRYWHEERHWEADRRGTSRYHLEVCPGEPACMDRKRGTTFRLMLTFRGF